MKANIRNNNPQNHLVFCISFMWPSKTGRKVFVIIDMAGTNMPDS